MSDRMSELSDAEDRARELIRQERNTSIEAQLEQVQRLSRALESRAQGDDIDSHG